MDAGSANQHSGPNLRALRGHADAWEILTGGEAIRSATIAAAGVREDLEALKKAFKGQYRECIAEHASVLRACRYLVMTDTIG